MFILYVYFLLMLTVLEHIVSDLNIFTNKLIILHKIVIIECMNYKKAHIISLGKRVTNRFNYSVSIRQCVVSTLEMIFDNSIYCNIYFNDHFYDLNLDHVNQLKT
ncbi:MAG: hypothetical protein MHMPM18_001321 [Marteilia pararefringens]